MSSTLLILAVMGGMILLLIAVRFPGRSLKWVSRAAMNGALGLAALIAFDMLGSPLGHDLGVSVQNTLVVGLLGLPGFALLVVSPWLLL